MRINKKINKKFKENPMVTDLWILLPLGHFLGLTTYYKINNYKHQIRTNYLTSLIALKQKVEHNVFYFPTMYN